MGYGGGKTVIYLVIPLTSQGKVMKMNNDNDKSVLYVEMDSKEITTFNELKCYLGVRSNSEVLRAAVKHTHKCLLG